MEDVQRTESIKSMVEQIDNGSIVLPEFQRDFVWDVAKTYDLFDSLVRDVFIGSLIYGIPSFEITVREIDDRSSRLSFNSRLEDHHLIVKGENPTGQKIRGFSLLGNVYKADSWRIMLQQVCQILIDKHDTQFAEKATELKGSKRHYIQGILLSLRNALLTGPGFGLITGLMTVLLGGVLFGFQKAADGGILLSSMGMGAFLWYGGLDVIQHYTLRVILWYRGHIPLNYVGFLNYAAERVFLQKVGGGYIFIHRLLLEHFAAMDVESRQVE